MAFAPREFNLAISDTGVITGDQLVFEQYAHQACTMVITLPETFDLSGLDLKLVFTRPDQKVIPTAILTVVDGTISYSIEGFADGVTGEDGTGKWFVAGYDGEDVLWKSSKADFLVNKSSDPDATATPAAAGWYTELVESKQQTDAIKAVTGPVYSDGAGAYRPAVAADMSVTDAGEHFDSDDVEGVLQEVGLKLNIKYINFKVFGAVGDGVSDDTSSFNAAITYLTANDNFGLYIPNGTYLLSSRVTINGNMPIRGEDRNKTIIKISSDGDGNGRGLIWEKADSSDIIGLELSNLTFDGSNGARPAIKYAQYLSIHNVSFIGYALRLDSINYFSLNDISIKDTSVAISLYDCSQGVISNIYGENVVECIDLASCEKLDIGGGVLYCSGESEDEIIDVGSSRDIIIHDIIAYDCYRGVTIKNENHNDLYNIKISNCLFRNYHDSGITFFIKGGDHLAPNPLDNFTIENCTIISNIENSRGILINRQYEDDAQPFSDILISNCDINSHTYAIATQTYSATAILEGEITIENCILKSSAIPLYFRHTDNVRISNCKLIGNSAYDCASILNCSNISFYNCYFRDGKKGASFTNCYALIFMGCSFYNLQQGAVSISITSIMDDSLPLIRFINNNVKNFGRGATASCVGVSITEATLTYSFINFCGNEIIYEANAYTPYCLGVGGRVIYNAIIKNNQYTGVSTFMTATTISNIDAATSVISDNISL